MRQQLDGPCSNLRVLDADVYDTLEFVAEAFGGIGAFAWNEGDCPLCVVGCATFAGIMPHEAELADEYGVVEESDNDDVVRRINVRLGNLQAVGDRVPFELWRQELCIVRGPHPEPSPNATWPD
jgi:hypothetical protein